MLEADANLPAFTLVFDREAYSPKFFESLWEERIAVITYRKNVKDQWAEDDFEDHKIHIDENQVKMKLCEKEPRYNKKKTYLWFYDKQKCDG